MTPLEIQREFDDGIIYTAYHVGPVEVVHNEILIRIEQRYRYYVDGQEDDFDAPARRRYAYYRQISTIEQEEFEFDAGRQQNDDQYSGSDLQRFTDAQLCTWIEEYFLHRERFPSMEDNEDNENP